MSLTVTESQAVFDLLRYLSGTRRGGHFAGDVVSDAEAIEAMEILARGAYKRMQVAPDGDLPALVVERLAAADSDGAAQAVCRELELQRFVGADGTTRYTWDTAAGQVLEPFEEWRRLQDSELGERLRDATTGARP